MRFRHGVGQGGQPGQQHVYLDAGRGRIETILRQIAIEASRNILIYKLIAEKIETGDRRVRCCLIQGSLSAFVIISTAIGTS